MTTADRRIRRGWIKYVLMTRKAHNKMWGLREIIRRVRLDEECQRILTAKILE